MERKFLLYVLYITLIEIREKSHETNDSRLFWITDMLHNIPLLLETDEDSKEAYEILVRKVKHLNVESWFEARKDEFFQRNPEFKTKFK